MSEQKEHGIGWNSVIAYRDKSNLCFSSSCFWTCHSPWPRTFNPPPSKIQNRCLNLRLWRPVLDLVRGHSVDIIAVGVSTIPGKSLAYEMLYETRHGGRGNL
jgi:hypothetical protein